ncbi:hypothetical protein LIER_21853 [Lithospermum erythrorhizon]|uniref:Uncharacterized protein n=1 Tax=Lithospermum erythrorhizon TaxID=34254 RepID=A0AAV3QUV8_LITER
MQPLIEELKELWVDGIMTYDASINRMFSLHATLLWTVSDFPAYARLSRKSTKGELACPHCGKNTQSHWLKHERKYCYTSHRRFLPTGHKLRRDKASFNGKIELERKPPTLSGINVLSELENNGVLTEYKKEDIKRRLEERVPDASSIGRQVRHVLAPISPTLNNLYCQDGVKVDLFGDGIPKDVVAKGILVSKDPKEKVANMPLGPDHWKVLLEEVVCPSYILSGSGDNAFTVGQAINIFLAWPEAEPAGNMERPSVGHGIDDTLDDDIHEVIPDDADPKKKSKKRKHKNNVDVFESSVPKKKQSKEEKAAKRAKKAERGAGRAAQEATDNEAAGDNVPGKVRPSVVQPAVSDE